MHSEVNNKNGTRDGYGFRPNEDPSDERLVWFININKLRT